MKTVEGYEKKIIVSETPKETEYILIESQGDKNTYINLLKTNFQCKVKYNKELNNVSLEFPTNIKDVTLEQIIGFIKLNMKTHYETRL